MSIMEVRKIGDPVLRSKAARVEEITDRTRVLIDNMVETMYHFDGVGLAAPQIGVLKRIITVDIGEGNLFKLINPEVINTGTQKEIREEGCLSIPEETGPVVRPARVEVRALDPEGKETIIEAEALLARALQHEIDHLNGELFVDKIVEIDDSGPERDL